MAELARWIVQDTEAKSLDELYEALTADEFSQGLAVARFRVRQPFVEPPCRMEVACTS
jgi:hypothetical protein